MKKKHNNWILPLSVFVFAFVLLTILQTKAKNPLLLAERFYIGAGWIEIILLCSYGAFLAYKMQDTKLTATWRLRSWSIFSIVFFSQLIAGLLLSDKFLMSGNLHLPVPAIILSGPIYRGQISVMTILFLSTVLLTGPAWCSQLCYFGAMDGVAAHNKRFKGPLKQKRTIKHTLLLLIIAATLALRFFKIDTFYAALAGGFVGIIGLLIILALSRKKGVMTHCVLYCPIGTLVSYSKYVNPFRLRIDLSCTFCLGCTTVCKYDALNLQDIKNKKPASTCTLCGDCLNACHSDAIHYKLFRLNPYWSRFIFLLLTLTIHVVFLGVARI